MFASVLSKRPFYILFTSFWGPSAKVAKSPKNVLFMSFWAFLAFVVSSILGTLWQSTLRRYLHPSGTVFKRVHLLSKRVESQ